MKKILAVALSTLSMSAFAQDGDLVLQGAKWIAKFENFICVEAGPSVGAPSSFEKLNVKFEALTADSTLDNGLIKASFSENGKSCRYNAIIFADNAASTYKIVQSKAYNTADNSECAEGKATLDEALTAGDYLYWGRPHRITFLASAEGAEVSCPGSSQVGVSFVVSGRIQK